MAIRKEEQRSVSPARTQALAIACGLLIGGFLFQRFGFDNNGLLIGWEWYLGAVLLAGIGLAGIFREVQFNATLGLCLGPTVVFFIEVVVLHPAESMWPVVLPLIFLFSFPVPIIGSTIGSLLPSTRVPRAMYFLALTSAILIGALFLPNIQNASRKRLETKIVPELLKQIYDAEIVYSSHQPDRNIACDGTLLPGPTGKLGWTHDHYNPTINRYLYVQNYSIELDCPTEASPRDFRIRAWATNDHPGPRFSIDETGKLIVVPVPPKVSNAH